MRQKWGQNFLVDRAVARRIVDALGDLQGRTVLEIGPGMGALTESLVGRAGRVTAVELDRDLARGLEERWGNRPDLLIVREDFLNWPLPALPPDLVVGNLPYSAANAILRKLLDWGAWKMGVFMVQKEVADRILADPDTTDYGVLTLAVQGKARVESLFDVMPGSFRPAPKVTSTVLRLSPLPRPLIRREETFFQVARAAFSQRRKMILNPLSHAFGLPKPSVESWLQGAGVDPKRRPQTLSLEDFNRLAEALPEEVKKIPGAGTPKGEPAPGE
jgi:16S rRNA (adenine1518-N6/adenine1519-N6)-dimethyltransferase